MPELHVIITFTVSLMNINQTLFVARVSFTLLDHILRKRIHFLKSRFGFRRQVLILTLCFISTPWLTEQHGGSI